MCLGDVGQQGATLAAGRVSEWLVRKVERLNGLFSVVSTSWQPLEDMGAEGANLGPVIHVGGRGKKSPGGRAAFVLLKGQGQGDKPKHTPHFVPFVSVLLRPHKQYLYI